MGDRPMEGTERRTPYSLGSSKCILSFYAVMVQGRKHIDDQFELERGTLRERPNRHVVIHQRILVV